MIEPAEEHFSIERCVGCFTHLACREWEGSWYCTRRCFKKREQLKTYREALAMEKRRKEEGKR